MKKLLCIVLSLAMILSLGLTAFAVEYGDVPADHYAAGAISRWSGYGVVQGSDGRFNPGGDLKRSESAQVLANLLKLTDTAGAKSFPDVTEDKWFKAAVDLVSAAGISNGDDHGMFNPDNSISRQEFFVMFARGLALEPQDTTGGVSADDAAEWAKGYINALTDKGYVRGNLDGVNPRANITRAEVMALMDQTISVYAYEYGETYTGTGEKIALVVGNSVILTGEYEDVIVLKSNAVTLKDAKINGELVLNDAATTVTQEGDTTVKNVKNNAGATIEDGIAPTPTPTPTPTSTPSSGGSSSGGTSSGGSSVAPPRGDVYYSIGLDVQGNGDVKLSATSVRPGAEITITVVPDEGAILTSAKDSDNNDLMGTITDNSATYVVTKNVTLSFVFASKISAADVAVIEANAEALKEEQATKLSAESNKLTVTVNGVEKAVQVIEEISIDTEVLSSQLETAAEGGTQENPAVVEAPVEVTLSGDFKGTAEAEITGEQFLNALLGIDNVAVVEASDALINAYVDSILEGKDYKRLSTIAKTADKVTVTFKGYNAATAVNDNTFDIQARRAVTALVKTMLTDMEKGLKPSELVNYINNTLKIQITMHYLNADLVIGLTVN